jgi:hypothetical protein
MSVEDATQSVAAAAAADAQPSLIASRTNASTTPVADNGSPASVPTEKSFNNALSESQSAAVPSTINAPPPQASQPQAASNAADQSQPAVQPVQTVSRTPLAYPEVVQGFEQSVDVAR